MKRQLLLCVIMLCSIPATAKEPALTYAISAENLIFEGREKTFVFVTIGNPSDGPVFLHGDYSTVAESFKAVTSKGKILNDSQWVGILRKKDRDVKSLPIPASGRVRYLYALDHLFQLDETGEITVTCSLSRELNVKVAKPK